MLLSVTINAKQTRLIRRRRNQETEEFKKKYRKRSGIEATNSGLKRTTGLSRLRVRGKASVFHAMLLKVTGWNIMRAASNPKLLARLLKEFGGFAGLFSRFAASSTHSWSGLTLQTNVLRNIDDFEAHRKKILVATIFCLRQPTTFVGRDRIFI
jgi:hypothetical protein